jgi:hypothetical protein
MAARGKARKCRWGNRRRQLEAQEHAAVLSLQTAARPGRRLFRSRPFERMMVKEDRRRVMSDGRGLAGPKEDCSAMARIVRVEVGRFDYALVGRI